MDRRRKNPRIFNILLAILCVAVFVGFAGFLLWNRRDVAQETARLQELAQEQQVQERAERQGQTQTDAPASGSGETADSAGNTDGAAGADGLTDDAETAAGDNGNGSEAAEADDGSGSGETSETDGENGGGETAEADGEAAAGDASEGSGTADAADTAEAQAASMGISCWGDEFYEPEAAEQYSYRAALQRILDENGYDLTVANKTLEGAGTLSMMKMAGVPQEELDAYIASHQASGGNLAVTETGIRDLTEEETDRWERDYIPVLMMGYYGGWNNDIQELIEQQQKILDTFGANKENFIIAGIPPLDKTVGTSEYDAAMEAAWGEHYVSTAQTSRYALSSKEGQEEIAQAIYEKLLVLNYIGAPRNTEAEDRQPAAETENLSEAESEDQPAGETEAQPAGEAGAEGSTESESAAA